MKNARLPEIIAMHSYWFGLSFMWNSLHVIILPAVLLRYVPETAKNTYLGLLTFFGLIIAMLVQPLSGRLSDRWRSRWGKRRPLIALGTMVDFLFLAVLAWAGGLLWLAIGYVGLQLSSNIAHGPAQGLLPDRVADEQLGRASGIKNFMDMAGLVVSSLLVGRLLSADAANAALPILVIAALLLAGLLVTLLGTREQSSLEALPASETSAQPKPLVGFNLLRWKPGKLKLGRFGWLVAARFAFLLAIYDIQVFAQYFIRDVIAPPNPVQLTGDLLAAITLALIGFAVLGGMLGDRIGHRRVLALAGLVAAAGSLLMMLARTPTTVLIFGGVLGMGVGLFLTSNWALANELAPAEQAGFYLGLTNLATAGAGAAGRLVGPGIDLLNNAAPGQFLGYTGMFIFGAICALASIALLRKV